jgi:hypothetical protein
MHMPVKMSSMDSFDRSRDMRTARLEHFRWFSMYSHPGNSMHHSANAKVPEPEDSQGSPARNMSKVLSYIFWAGLGLAFPGTLVAYASYALTSYDTQIRGHWPIVTTMISHWPLVGCLTFGAGITLLAASVMAQAAVLVPMLPETSTGKLETIILCSALAMEGAWGVVGSSQTFGMRTLHIVHDVFALVFLVFSAYAYACVIELLDSNLGTLFKGRQWVRVWMGAVLFFSAAAIACGVALAFAREEYYFLGRRAWKQALALSQLCVLAVYLGAYVTLAGVMGMYIKHRGTAQTVHGAERDCRGQ